MSTADKPTPKQEPSHYDRVEAILNRYETEFCDLISNPNTPADQVASMLTAIHALRIEKAHQRP